jgi:hypothetical protein
VRTKPIVEGKNLVVMGYRLTGPFLASRRMVRFGNGDRAATKWLSS